MLNNTSDHAMPGVCPLIQCACVLELVVDGSRGRTINGQWAQDPGSVVVSGCVVHCINIARAYEQGYSGWYTVDRESLMCLGLMDSPSQMTQYLEDRVKKSMENL